MDRKDERNRTTAMAVSLVLAGAHLLLWLIWWGKDLVEPGQMGVLYPEIYLIAAVTGLLLALGLWKFPQPWMPLAVAVLLLALGVAVTWADLHTDVDYLAYIIATFALGVVYSSGPRGYGLLLGGSFILLTLVTWWTLPGRLAESDYWTQGVLLGLAYAGCLLLERQRRQADDLATRLEDLNAELRESAFRDPLTGLHNRRFLTEFLDGKRALAVRMSFPLTAVMIDIDHFKRVNDTLGHATGDLVLRDLAGAIQKGTRESDLAARYGGEEFILILPQATNRSASKVVVRILERVRSMSFPGVPWQITFSAGVAQLEPGETIEHLLERADRRLYEAKRTRNLVVGGAD